MKNFFFDKIQRTSSFLRAKTAEFGWLLLPAPGRSRVEAESLNQNADNWIDS